MSKPSQTMKLRQHKEVSTYPCLPKRTLPTFMLVSGLFFCTALGPGSMPHTSGYVNSLRRFKKQLCLGYQLLENNGVFLLRAF